MRLGWLGVEEKKVFFSGSIGTARNFTLNTGGQLMTQVFWEERGIRGEWYLEILLQSTSPLHCNHATIITMAAELLAVTTNSIFCPPPPSPNRSWSMSEAKCCDRNLRWQSGRVEYTIPGHIGGCHYWMLPYTLKNPMLFSTSGKNLGCFLQCQFSNCTGHHSKMWSPICNLPLQVGPFSCLPKP